MTNVEVIIHIGQSKAGSTAIQKSLMGATEALEAQGAFYLGLMCEHAKGKKRPWQRAGGWPDLAELGEEAAAKEFAEVAVGAVRSLDRSRIPARDPVERDLPSAARRSSFQPSMESPTWERSFASSPTSAVPTPGRSPPICSGGSSTRRTRARLRPFRDWLGARHKRNARELKPWLGLPGAEVLVRNFDTCGDVAQDFLACAGLDPKSITTVRGNESPNPVAVALWALHNGQTRRPGDADRARAAPEAEAACSTNPPATSTLARCFGTTTRSRASGTKAERIASR